MKGVEAKDFININTVVETDHFVNTEQDRVLRLFHASTFSNSGSIKAYATMIEDSVENSGEIKVAGLSFLGDSMKNTGKIDSYVFFAPNFSSYHHEGEFHAHKLVVTESNAKNFDPSEYDELITIPDHIDPWTLNDCQEYVLNHMDIFQI